MRQAWIVGTAIAALSATPIAAAGKCQITESLAECWQEYVPLAEAQAEGMQKAEKIQAKDELKRTVTGADTGGAVTATNTKSFLPLMAFSGLLGVEEDNETGTYTVDLNFLLPNRVREKNGQLQVVVDSEPTLYEPIKAKLPEDGRDEAAKALEGGFGNYDDVTVTFNLNLLTASHGRSFKRHAKQYDALFGEVAKEHSPSPDKLLAIVKNHLPEDSSVAGGSQAFADITEEQWTAAEEATGIVALTFIEVAEAKLGMTEEAEGAARGAQTEKAVRDAAESIMAEFESAAAQEADINDELEKAVQSYHLPAFATLLDNQPQLYFSASKRFRDDLAGPDELSVKVTWEKPTAPNLAAFNHDFREAYDTSCQAASRRCLDEFQTYVNDNEEAMERSDRFSFSLEYVETDALAIELPDRLDEPLAFAEAEKLIVKAGWGRQLREDIRLDFDASWENVSGDPNRRDRGVATLTLTRKLGDMSFPISVVYANRSEFIDTLDVDERVSAHVGINYRLSSKSKAD